MADSTNNSYNDRALSEPSEDALPKPQIEIIVDGNSVFKPSMKTYFVDEYDEEESEYSSRVVGTYCTCDLVTSTHTVCTCLSVCTCDAVATPAPSSTTCTCDTVATPAPVETTCSCDSVCTCQAVCSCDGYQTCSCVSYTPSGSGGNCGAPCACVPVH